MMKAATNPFKYLLPKSKNTPIYIGITGHRDVDQKHKQEIIGELEAKFRSIRQSHPGAKVIVYTALAEGPDQWAAWVADKNRLDYLAVIPMDIGDYLKESILSGLEGESKNRALHSFNDLLHKAMDTILLSPGGIPKSGNAYQVLGEFLVKNCDHLIGIWDGIYNGKPGGTSDVMEMAYTLEDHQGNAIKRTRPLTVHWLSVSRAQNPFPVVKPLTWQVFDPNSTQQVRNDSQRETGKRRIPIKLRSNPSNRWYRGFFTKKKWILGTLLLTFIFGSLGYQEEKRLETEYLLQLEWQEVVSSLENFMAVSHWYQEREGVCFLEFQADRDLCKQLAATKLGRLEDPVKRTLTLLREKVQHNLYAFSGSPESMLLLQVELDKLNNTTKAINRLYQFQVKYPKAFLDGLMYSSGLLFTQPTLFQYARGHFVKVALLTGFLFLLLTSISILDMLVFHKFFNKFRLYWFVIWSSVMGWLSFLFTKVRHKPEITLLIGLGKVGKEIAFNFLQSKQSHQKLVLLDLRDSDPAIDMLEEEGAVFFRGDGSRKDALGLSHLNRVKELFICGETDEINVRILQQLDRMYNQQQLYLHRWRKVRKICRRKPQGVNLYVHVSDYSIRFFLKEAFKSKDVLRINTFHLNEELSRSLLKKFPLDRTPTTTTKCATVILVGYTSVACEIARYILNIGHYTAKAPVNIVFLSADPQADEHHFFGILPLLKNRGEFETYVFPGSISFEQLPAAESGMLDDKGPFFQHIGDSNLVNYYFCLENGVHNASMLAIILEKLEIKRTEMSGDIQAFYYYNHPEQEGNSYVASQLNKRVAQLPVFGFGSLFESCKLGVIRKTELDFMAKQVAFLYYMLYSYQRGSIPSLDAAIDHEGGHDLSKVNELEFIKKLWQPQYVSHFLSGGEDTWLDHVWATLSEEHKESNRFAADHLDIKWRALGLSSAEALKGHKLTEKEKVLLAEMEHRRWCAEKLLLGFTLYTGPKSEWKRNGKNLRKERKHMDLVPFGLLHADEQQKDYNLIEGMTFFHWEV